MGLALSPSYRDLYPDKDELIEDLLTGIGSQAILCTLAVVNAFLDVNTKQQDLLAFLLRRQTKEIFRDTLNRCNKYHASNEGKPWHLFSKHIVAEFMIWVLKNSNSIEEDTSAAGDLKIFKSYLLIAEKFNKNQTNITLTKGDEENFLHLSWPIFSGQIEFNLNPSLEFQIFKSLVLIDQIIKDESISKYAIGYGKKIGIPLYHYINNLFKLFEHRTELDFGGWKVPRYFFKFSEGHLRIFKHLFLNLEEINSEDKFDENYRALKKYPLLEHKDGNVTVLNWNYLKLKVYNGFLFDFYYSSGITEKIPKFPDFKSWVGEFVTEKILFRCLLKSIFSEKFHYLYFPDEDGMPDGYLRIGHRVFIFELKDYIINSSVIGSQSFDEIKKTIDSRFVESSRGIKQVIKYIKKLNENEYSFDKIPEKLESKIEVYPVIVYTDPFLGLPGVNFYVNEKFQAAIPETKFKEVNNLALIDMEFLFDNLPYFKNLRLDKLIKQYFNKSKRTLKDMHKRPSVNKWFDAYMPLDSVVNIQRSKKDKLKLETFISGLDLKLKE